MKNIGWKDHMTNEYVLDQVNEKKAFKYYRIVTKLSMLKLKRFYRIQFFWKKTKVTHHHRTS